MAVSKNVYDRYADAMQLVSDKGKAELMRILPTLNTSSDDAFLADLQRVVPPLVTKYGRVSALLSARFYDRARRAAGGGDDYVATTFGGEKLEEVDRAVIYAATGGMALETVPSFLTGVVDMGIKSYGRETQIGNADIDPFCEGYESIPGANPCAFCIIKALNTWNYHNYQGQRLEEEISDDAWHANCNCQLLPIFRDDEQPDLVDFDEMYQAYDDAAQAVYSGDMPDELKERIEKAKEANEANDGTAKWSTLNEITIAMRYQNGDMH